MQNSKLNTVLLIVLIILVAGGLWMMNKKKEISNDQSIQIPSGYTQTNTTGSTADHQPTSNHQNAVVLDMNNPYVGTYATLFAMEFAQPVNYAGHFRLVSPGCGSSCFYLYALDKNTGETYKVAGASFQDYTVRGTLIETVGQNGTPVNYTFDESTKKFVVVGK